MQVYSLDSHCEFGVTKSFPQTTMQNLKALLEDTTVVKILHDSRRPSAALLYQQGIALQGVFDTQVTFLPDTAYCVCCTSFLLRVQF